jgi:hypothetical protein
MNGASPFVRAASRGRLAVRQRARPGLTAAAAHRLGLVLSEMEPLSREINRGPVL